VNACYYSEPVSESQDYWGDPEEDADAENQQKNAYL
jgi:hypothetical protein